MRELLKLTAYFGLPAAYIAMCIRMRIKAIEHPPYRLLFLLFGTIGGLLLLWLSSGEPVLAMIVGAVFFLASSCAILVSSVELACRPERSFYHWFALWGGFGWTAIFISLFFFSLTRS